MVVLIDNYDSFVYNLYQYIGELGHPMTVVRNDTVTVEDIAALDPDHIIISPGPCSPREAGVSNDALLHFAGRVPLFGVCLGHQCIGHVFGVELMRARLLMHGKTSPIQHTGAGVFRNLPNPFSATRYHSLVIAPDSLPPCLEVTAWADADEIMGVRHREYPDCPVEGVQFHPEAILTEPGMDLLRNFLAYKKPQ